MTNVSKVKLRSISVMKFSLIFLLSGLINGFVVGLVFLFFLQAMLAGWGMDAVPTLGLILLSFLIVPIVMAILSWIIGLIIGLFTNLFLKAIRGLDMYFEELV